MAGCGLAGCGTFCLVGVILAFALGPEYLARVKSSQVRIRLYTLGVQVERYCDEHQTYPGGAGPMPPTHGSSPQTADFSTDPVFRELPWGIDDPDYYSYSIIPTDYGVLLLAEGDLDEDGIKARYMIECREDCACRTDRVENELE